MSRYPKNLQRLGASTALHREAMAMEREDRTRLAPAPVKYPNGGGIKAMSGNIESLDKKHNTERDALDAKHAAEKAALEHKHSEERKKFRGSNSIVKPQQVTAKVRGK